MTRNGVAASVAENKERNPGKYCPVKRCLWRTGGGYCPRHRDREAAFEILNAAQDREFTPSEAEAIHRAMVRENEQEKACQK